jgi:hypothetical protein
MIKKLLESLKYKVTRVYHRHVLNGVNTMEEFNRYIKEIKPDVFLKYKEASTVKRLEFTTVIEKLSLNLNSINFLDIGPGFGDSMDICHERGASQIEFVEWDPFFFTFNRLKKWCTGHQENHLLGLHSLDQNKFDFIWIKGSLSADKFNKWPIRKISPAQLNIWLDQLLRLGRPSCTIILCPHWMSQDAKRKIENVKESIFTKTILSKGFNILPTILHHNHEPEYPVTFFRKLS